MAYALDNDVFLAALYEGRNIKIFRFKK